MAGKTDPSRMVRVIGLLPCGSTALASSGFVRLVRVGSGYEAAGELLAEPASALLVDLAMLTAGHGPLLKLAAELNVPVVAFGTVTSALDGSVLVGVRLVGAEQASDALRGLLAGVDVDSPAAAPDLSSAEEEPLPLEKPLTRDEIDSILSDR
ncbi:MAG: hypothetical protein K8R91_01230 [Phycisphaerae bacterium]|nr:hypothetical protein [Phycisphaerae bacterium]